MKTRVRVLAASELQPGGARVVTVSGKALALFNVDGAFYALENRCAHNGGPLGEGTLDGATVFCPLHGWTYDVTSGRSPDFPGEAVEAFPAEVHAGQVYVVVPGGDGADPAPDA